jgi:hypothetical protein
MSSNFINYDYSLTSKIGEGAYGKNFEALNEKLDFSQKFILPICTKKIDLSAEDMVNRSRKKQKAIKETQL